MSTTEDDKPITVPVGRRLRGSGSLTFVAFGIGVLAAYHVALALSMAVDPHGFFKQIGPFGIFNSHYVRDLATYNAAIGVALAIAIRHHSWRVPVLALVTLQFAFHSVNHLVDVADARPEWIGYLDLALLVVMTLVLGWLLRVTVNPVPLSLDAIERIPAVRIEFPADYPERARRFWAELLGVELEVRHESEGEGWQTRSGDPAVGVHARGRGPGDSFSLPYFAVSNVAEALETVEAFGGSVIHPGEKSAICKDSEGSPFGLTQESPSE